MGSGYFAVYPRTTRTGLNSSFAGGDLAREPPVRSQNEKKRTPSSSGSPEAHGEEHVTFSKGFDRMRHIRLQHERLPAAEPMPCRAGLDCQFPSKAVNDYLTRGSMLRQPTARLEGEQQDPKRPAVHQPRLSMAILGRMRLGA